jgi:dihydroorotate dehydrogenase (NAD+) catalytic subunit
MIIDPHVHCRDGKQAYKETVEHALQVAERAGVDAIFDMPNTDPPILIREQIIERLRLAERCNSKVFYGLYIGVSSDTEQVIEAVKIWKEFFPRVVGLKMFAGHSVGDLAVIDLGEQEKIYRILGEVGFTGVLAVHCEKENFLRPEFWNPENPESHCLARPWLSEFVSIQDQVGFALKHGFKGNLHIPHISCPESVEYINMMKKNRPELRISCGVTPHHLFFNDNFMKSENGLLLKMNPPLRSEKQQKQLLEFLRRGMIDWIETDHAPHTLQEKINSPYMSGVPWLNQWPKVIERLRGEGFSEKQVEDLVFNNIKRVFNVDVEKTSGFGVSSREYDSEFDLGVSGKIRKVKINGKEVMPFTIPSGIITTHPRSLEKISREIPEIGILTTKSIGPEPRMGNREPVLAQYASGCFINAVGLTNPGAEEFAKELSKVDLPSDKFLLCSIFGKDAEEFVKVAKILEDYVDGFEINLSCPHAKGYGMQLGQDPEIVFEITKAVVDNSSKPIFAKLTPNAGNIGEIAKAAVDAGAKGIVAINTVGPGYYSVDGKPVLTNKFGGLSGRGITPLGVKCVKQIREAIGPHVLIIGMGGISKVKDVEEYASCGADVFGIGSALVGMDDEDLKKYFSCLVSDLENGTDDASLLLKEADMEYKKVEITEIENSESVFKIFKTKSKINAEPGQFVFAWIPEVGEKPFSVMDDDPFTLGVLERGEFTKAFNSLKAGDCFYIRGPYGKGVGVSGGEVVLVGGGCGLAGLYLIGKRFYGKAKITTLLGAKDKSYLPYVEEFKKLGEVYVATEDGSLGKKGMITELFENLTFSDECYFFNCGPKAMVEAVLGFEKQVTDSSRIFTSVDYKTGCGVGICGSCSDEKGRRTCIEGPFMGL